MSGSAIRQIYIDRVLESASPDSLILTVNRRLSLEMGIKYSRSKLDQGHRVWESANCTSWYDWVHGLFLELVDHGQSDLILLTPHQALILWEQIIQNDRDYTFLRPASAAKLANEAWTLIHSWGIEQKQLTHTATAETERLLSWAEEFHVRCVRNNWIDQASVPDTVIEGMRSGLLKPPAEIILAGFDEITPQQQRLLDLLYEKGSQIDRLTHVDESTSVVRRFQAVDITQELETAAAWSIKRLRENSGARVGIVIPQLLKLRNRVETVYKRALHPEAISQEISDSNKFYNISLGVPLTQCPLVIDAFLLLNLSSGALSSGDISRLLRSPFLFGSSQERGRRARLDAHIRSSVGERTISLDTLIRQTGSFNQDDDACPVLLISLQNFRRRVDQIPSRQSPQQWTDEFQALLNSVGWGRYEQMNSIEHQQIERFNGTMTSFQMLGQVQQSMGRDEAIQRLYNIAQETLFQAQGSDAPIQIVGTLEASGLGFDHLWVIGLSDDNWPAPASPNPLLPISIQRKLGLPHASPQRELEYASAITQRLLSSAPEVVVSHAGADGVNQLRVSPLVADIPLATVEDLDCAQVVDISHAGFGSTELEVLVDNKAPPLPVGSHLPGGSRLLADQSACPFRAFANHRLGATDIEDPVSGVDARTRGIMTHRVLQGVWQQIRDQEHLLAMDENQLGRLVTDVVSQELSRIRPIRPETFAPRFIAIEQERLTDLILEWMQLESQRAPFAVVSLERRERVGLAGLEMDIVADRIDQLEDGTKLIIDYKTGKSLSYAGWFEQRIEEPQLPLYATTNAATISGVFLAGINRANLRIRGVAEQDGVVPGVKAFGKTKEAVDYAGWDGLKTEWKQRLELLAHEVLDGRAEVRPKDINRDCVYCPLPSLCRIHEWGEES